VALFVRAACGWITKRALTSSPYPGAMRPELGLTPDIDREIELLAESGKRFGEWPRSIRQLWRAEKLHRRRHELAFLNAIALAWSLVSLALDFSAGPEVLAAGLPLRLGIVAPLYLLAIAMALYGGWYAQRWTSIAAVLAFVWVGGYLGMHIAPEQLAEYVMASGLLLAMGIAVLPIRVPWLALMAGLTVAGLWAIWLMMPARGQEELVLMAFVTVTTCVSLLIPARSARIKDEHFIYALRAQIASRDLMSANEQLRALSDHDDLTGLPNRRNLERVFDEAFRTSVAAGTDLAVIMIDVDHFKRFNDTYGHVAGDRTLAQIARTLERSICGPGRMVARYGGEEFIAVLDGTEEQSALRIADGARRAIADRRVSVGDRRRSSVTVSMGVTLRRRADRSPLSMIERADAALYEAKEAGRNIVRLAGRSDGKPPPAILKEQA